MAEMFNLVCKFISTQIKFHLRKLKKKEATEWYPILAATKTMIIVFNCNTREHHRKIPFSSLFPLQNEDELNENHLILNAYKLSPLCKWWYFCTRPLTWSSRMNKEQNPLGK